MLFFGGMRSPTSLHKQRPYCIGVYWLISVGNRLALRLGACSLSQSGARPVWWSTGHILSLLLPFNYTRNRTGITPTDKERHTSGHFWKRSNWTIKDHTVSHVKRVRNTWKNCDRSSYFGTIGQSKTAWWKKQRNITSSCTPWAADSSRHPVLFTFCFQRTFDRVCMLFSALPCFKFTPGKDSWPLSSSSAAAGV